MRPCSLWLRWSMPSSAKRRSAVNRASSRSDGVLPPLPVQNRPCPFPVNRLKQALAQHRPAMGTPARSWPLQLIGGDDHPGVEGLALVSVSLDHGDNLDTAGRALLPAAGVVLTTTDGARRLGGNARGLQPWATTLLKAPGRPTIQITATPCRHGPPLSRPIARGGGRLRPGLGGPGPSGSVDHRRHRAVRRRPPGRRPPPSGHRPCSTSAAYASRSPGRSATP
jgi:hypothetical protein